MAKSSDQLARRNFLPKLGNFCGIIFRTTRGALRPLTWVCEDTSRLVPALLTWRGSLLPYAALYNVVSPPRPTAMRAFVYRFLHLPSYHGGLIQSLYSSPGVEQGCPHRLTCVLIHAGTVSRGATRCGRPLGALCASAALYAPALPCSFGLAHSPMSFLTLTAMSAFSVSVRSRPRSCDFWAMELAMS